MSKYLDLLQPAIDSFGLIAQLPSANRDGGDSLQREGMFAIAVCHLLRSGKIDQAEYFNLKTRYILNLARLECCPGNYRRHVDPTMWYSDCNRMSRDQWTPNVIAMGMMELDSNLERTFLGHMKRAMLFTTNTRRNGAYPPGHPKHESTQSYSWKLPDLTAFASWGFYIRSFRAWPLYPLLLITDLDLLANSLIWIYNFKMNPSNTDILNHTNCLLQARWSMATPISWLARKLLNVNKVQARLDAYFENSGPALNVVFKDFLSLFW